MVEKDGIYGVINHDETVVIPFVYDDYLVLMEDFIYASIKEKQGLIDYKNKVLIPFEYDNLFVCSNERIIAKQNGKYGFINFNNERTSDFVFDNLIKEKWYENFLACKGKKWGIVDEKFNTVVDFIYDKWCITNDSITLTNEEGAELVITKDTENGSNII